MNQLEIYQAMRVVLLDQGWNQGATYNPVNNKVCLIGAYCWVVDGEPTHFSDDEPFKGFWDSNLEAPKAGADLRLLAEVIEAEFPERRRTSLAYEQAEVRMIVGFNDDLSTIEDEAVAVLEKAIARAQG